MTHQVNLLLDLDYNATAFGWFVFFSTMCSYNFHWLLTHESHEYSIRIEWTQVNRTLHRILFVSCGIGSAIFFLPFIQWWPAFAFAVVLTFLYSAPKIPYFIFKKLRRVAYGKTIFLSAVWTYVTTVLPMIISTTPFNSNSILFIISRFMLIYAICIIFDMRDREQDKKEGIQSLITYLSLNGVKRLFYFSLILFTISVLLLNDTSYLLKIILLVPGIITALLYNISIKSHSDYLYYFVLDGLMMLSSLVTLFMSI